MEKGYDFKEAKSVPPYGDPAWYQTFKSPYYNDSHRRFRAAMRAFVDKEVTPYCDKWEEDRRLPSDYWSKCYAAGFLPGLLGLGRWPTEFVGEGPIMGGVKPEEWDYFHELILIDEFCRCGSGGAMWGVLAGISIGLPPIINFGSDELKQKVAGPVLRGEKVICLCITEPYAGSDVAGLRCEAKRTDDGKHFIINGEKKWITNSQYADYFSVAVRTGGPGMKGISLILVEKSMPGVRVRPMRCSGVSSSGTGYVTFDDVKVPVTNIIGKENDGFRQIMSNFNHERWQVIAESLRFARVLYEESFTYAMKRKTFGKPLIDNQLIRAKLGDMAKQIESGWAWLELITYQMNTLSHEEVSWKVSGPIGLLKVFATPLFELCAREAAQIFGGLGYTKGGQGEKVERLARDVRAMAIGGGSEEIMRDLGVRQAIKHASL